MKTSDSKLRSSAGGNTSGPGATGEDLAIPPSADPIERYRYLVNAAPLETIERATAEMLEALSPADGERIRHRLDQFPELRADEPRGTAHRRPALPRFGAQAEKRRPGALERAVRAGAPAEVGDDLCLVLARAFVSTPTASAFLSGVDADAQGRASEQEPDSDPDFSDEFGYESGYAGGSGFENVEFDRWI
jgi:hypothetical protein